jgi:uncharacterized protein YacL
MTAVQQPPRGRGRPVLGAVFGLLLGVFLTFDLLMMSVFALDSVMVLVLPIVMLLVGVALGWFQPLRFLKR